jgi:hypothetical protein
MNLFGLHPEVPLALSITGKHDQLRTLPDRQRTLTGLTGTLARAHRPSVTRSGSPDALLHRGPLRSVRATRRGVRLNRRRLAGRWPVAAGAVAGLVRQRTTRGDHDRDGTSAAHRDRCGARDRRTPASAGLSRPHSGDVRIGTQPLKRRVLDLSGAANCTPSIMPSSQVS